MLPEPEPFLEAKNSTRVITVRKEDRKEEELSFTYIINTSLLVL